MFLSTGPGQRPVLRHVAPATGYMSGSDAFAWAAIDADGDGNMDLVALHNWAPDAPLPGCVADDYCHHIAIRRGDGAGNLREPERYRLDGLPARRMVDAFVEDIDMDGIDDVAFTAVTPGPGPQQAYYLRREPAGGLAGPKVFLTLPDVSAPLFFGDLNADGLRDVIYGNAVQYRRPDGSFASPIGLRIYNFLASAWSVVADFDGDGHADLLNFQFETFGRLPYFVTYLQRQGELGAPFFLYEPPENNLSKADAGERQVFGVGDFNGDGCRDVALAHGYAGILLLLGRNCRPSP